VSKLATVQVGVFLNLSWTCSAAMWSPEWSPRRTSPSPTTCSPRRSAATASIPASRRSPGPRRSHDQPRRCEAPGRAGRRAQVSGSRVSNDNPFSESCFRTTKYQPDYPGRFRDLAHARRWLEGFRLVQTKTITTPALRCSLRLMSLRPRRCRCCHAPAHPRRGVQAAP
jgi:hypothetical protein